MNLQGFTAGIIGAVSPPQPANLYSSTGQSETTPDGTKQPLYAPVQFISAQTQPLTTGDMRKLDSLNIQGVNFRVHLTGDVRGIQRINSLGGDLVVFADGTTYLVRAVLENWFMDGWCAVALVLQNDAKVPYVQRPRF